MPLHEYACACGYHFDELTGIHEEAPATAMCPQCCGMATKMVAKSAFRMMTNDRAAAYAKDIGYEPRTFREYEQGLDKAGVVHMSSEEWNRLKRHEGGYKMTLKQKEKLNESMHESYKALSSNPELRREVEHKQRVNSERIQKEIKDEKISMIGDK